MAKGKEQSYLPSRQNIRQVCKQIRAGWTEKERVRRCAEPQPQAWQVPVIGGLDLSMDETAE